jgi:proline dehydrogenase
VSLFDRAVVGLLPLIPKPVVGYFSRRYIAGTRLEQALEVIRGLNARGMMATLDVLGEHITRLEQAEAPRDAYLRALEEIRRSGVDSNVSIKLSQLGLAIDPEACYRNLRRILERAREAGNFVRIDMEDSSLTDATLAVYRRLRAEGFENTGVVLQAMLRRTVDDAEELGKGRTNVRLCKGIYVEPRRIAYRDRELVNRNYALALERLFQAGSYVGIATHDERLVWEALRLIRAFGLRREQYEFQMLLGVEEELRRILVEGGHRLRVYVPFGEQWYAYSVRRLRENPRIAGYVAKSVLVKEPRPA